ncbi:MAG: TIGR04282 family arsenosugar biosynthesis glycosyltransferase [Sphingosinicella sp.]
MSQTRIVIFAKAPVPGRVKTRLIPALGAEGAAALAAQMLARTIAEALLAGVGPVELCGDPEPSDPAWQGHVPVDVATSGQGEGDLGERLARAAKRVLDKGETVLLIGADCPDLDHHRLRAASQVLRDFDAVIFPAADGGYVLLGLAKFGHGLFEEVEWGAADVATATIGRIGQLGWTLHVGETLRDVDVPADLA